MKLAELFKSIREESLSKDQLEDYHTQLSALYAEMELELAVLEKEMAIFLDLSEEKSVAGAERKWNATEKGQRMIDLKHYLRASGKMLSSLRSRLYSVY